MTLENKAINVEQTYQMTMSMHNHYSNARASIVALAAPILVTISGFSIAANSAYFTYSMLAFQFIFFGSAYFSWKYFSSKMDRIKTLLLAIESGALKNPRLFSRIYSLNDRDKKNNQFSIKPRDPLDFIVLIFGLCTLISSIIPIVFVQIHLQN